MSTETKCQYIFSNLLKTLDGENDPQVSSSIFIRELLVETPRCDDISSLFDVRTAYETKLASFDDSSELNGGIVARMKTGPGRLTSNDEEAASMVAYHYNEWTHDRLLASFSWSNWFGYQILKRWERTLGFLTLGTMGYGGYRYLRRGVPRMMQNSADFVHRRRGAQNGKAADVSMPNAQTPPSSNPPQSQSAPNTKPPSL